MTTKNSSFTAKLNDVKGCLKSIRTTTGRRRYVDDEDILLEGLDPFLVDAELKIAQSKAVRRMLDKTQVLTDPHNLHIRKRITHAGEVTAIASLTCAILGLNFEMAKAIALAHDIGHTPFGHDGEKFLTEISGKTFKHEIMGVVLAQHIERFGKGLNLTHEVLSGICRYETGQELSPEAAVVMHADRIAYVTGDYNDIERIGFPIPRELKTVIFELGANQRERVNNLVCALCLESAEKGRVSFEESKEAKLFDKAKQMMYAIYPKLNASNASAVLERIYLFVKKVVSDVDPSLLLALMTDHDAVFLASQPVLDYYYLQRITVAELLPFLRGREIRWWEADLDW